MKKIMAVKGSSVRARMSHGTGVRGRRVSRESLLWQQ